MNTLRNAPERDVRLPSEAADDRRYYSISEVAALLGVSRVSVWRWIRAGRLPVARLGHRTTRIAREDLERCLLQVSRSGSRASEDAYADSAAHAAARAPRGDWHDVGPTEHFVQFYEADAVLVEAVADYIGAALGAGEAGIVVATPSHRMDVEARLAARGLDLAAARASGSYVPLDAAETLARFMVDGEPDPDQFVQVVGGIIGRAAEGGRPVRAFGEMVALLAAEGHVEAAIRLEGLWNQLRVHQPFALFCAYPMDRLGGEALAALVGDVCAAHSRVIPAESYNALATADDRLRAIALLQQKARSLQAEVAQRAHAEERLREALEAERVARAAAEGALALRDEFLSVAAHELRTPITALTGHAQLAARRIERDGDLPPERVHQTLQVITGQASKLTRLIGRLLDVSRLQSGQLALEREPTDLAALVQQVVSAVQAASSRQVIRVEAPASLEARLDPLRLEQVLTNLLDNAIKFSPNRDPIDVVLVRPEPGVAELSVRDRGLGIPPEKRGQIFQRFYQAHAGDNRSGLGLGLYICRQIVELHGGAIQVDFPADGGTRFTVRLPLTADEPAVVPGVPSPRVLTEMPAAS